MSKKIHGISKPEFNKIKRHERAMRKRIRENPGNSIHIFIERYLKSYDSMFVAAVKGYGKTKSHRRPSRTDFMNIVGELDPWVGTDEAIYVKRIEKNGSEKLILDHEVIVTSADPEQRSVMAYGFKNRTLQHLVLGLLKSCSKTHPNQYATRGGVPAAIRQVKRNLKDGYTWITETDIKQCFLSFDRSKIPGLLLLPEQVTERVIFPDPLFMFPGNFIEKGDSANLSEVSIPGTSDHELFADIRWGLPQGSSVSPLVCDILLAPMIYGLPSCAKVVVYFDNFLVMAKDEESADKMTSSLRSALKAHPAGPLQSHKHKKYHPGHDVDFLGHTIFKSGDGYHVRPNLKNRQVFDFRINYLMKKIRTTSKPNHKRKCVRKAEKYVHSWTAGFSEWNEAEKVRKKQLKKIAKLSKPQQAAAVVGGAQSEAPHDAPF